MLRRFFLATALSAVLVTAASAATVNYTAKLSGHSEVPRNSSKGTGRLEASFDTQTKVLNYTLTFAKLSGPATAAHIHGPATRKDNAGVVAPLGEKNPTSPVSGTVTLTDDQAKALASSKLYVNVHTAANPGGEIRGQITSVHAKRMRAKAKPAAAAPAPAAPAATPAPAAAPK